MTRKLKPMGTKQKSTKEKVQKAKAKLEPRKRLSALDAAHAVLLKAGTAMNTLEMIAAMAKQGLWSSPKGKTPQATLHSAISKEIAKKGNEARFRKAERGKFESV